MALSFVRSSTRRSTRSALCVVLAAVTASVAMSASSDANAFVVKTTTGGDFVHWDTRDVDYAIHPSVAEATPGSVDATLRAMRTWSGSVGAPELHAHAAGEGDPQKPGYDEKNGVFYIAGGYKPAGRALAITILTYDNTSGRILDADIVFNGAYSFTIHRAASDAAQSAVKDGRVSPSATDGIAHGDTSATDPATTAPTYDLHHVVAHELGHSLGLNDELERSEVLMYRYTPPNDPGVRAPTPDDIEGLAQLYSTEISAGGNGCGNATVAPKKPSRAASQGAMVAVFGLLVFLALRARNDRRARFAFVAAAAMGAVALMPSVSGSGVAHASEATPTTALGHARARVTKTTTSTNDGLLETTYALATTACRTLSCPRLGHGTVWGGVSGNLRQEVGGQHAPVVGEDVDVSFTSLPSGIAPLSTAFAGHDPQQDLEIRVLTPAR